MDPLVQMDQSVEPLRYVRGAVTFGPIRGLPHTHTHTLGGTLRGSLLRGAGQCELAHWCGVGETARHSGSQPGHTHTLPARLRVCVCSGWVSLCLAVSQTATGLIGRRGQELQQAVGQRVNTHTIQRCCMRNQCDFGKLHNVNLF